MSQIFRFRKTHAQAVSQDAGASFGERVSLGFSVFSSWAQGKGGYMAHYSNHPITQVFPWAIFSLVALSLGLNLWATKDLPFDFAEEARAQAQTGARMTLLPSSASAPVGQTFTVAVNLDTASQATDGVDVHYLWFDPTLMEVVDADAVASGVQIMPGTLYAMTLTNSVDNVAGRIDFSQVAAPGKTFTSSGTLAAITFKAQAEGTATLTFDFTSGSGIDTNVAAGGEDILASVGSATFTLTSGFQTPPPSPSPTPPPPSPTSPPTSGGGGGGGIAPATTGTITGKVTVNFLHSAPLAGVSVVLQPGNLAAQTDSDGRYTFTSVMSGSFTLALTKSGYITYTSQPFSVRSGQTVVKDFFLRVQGVSTTPGSLIKGEGHSAVYYLGADGKRYVFPNEKVYKSWYADFSSVVTIPATELTQYPIGGNITYRSGTRLIKIQTDPKVYAVEPSGVLRWVTTEAIAQTLYGADWYTRIDDVPDAFFVNYDPSGENIMTPQHPVGTLIKYGTSPDVFVIAKENNQLVKRKIADYATFLANRFQDKFILTIPSSSVYPDGTAVTGSEADFVRTAGP